MGMKIDADNIDDLVIQLNQYFKKVNDALNEVRGYSGDITMEARNVHNDDIIFNNTDKGIVLKDDGSPTKYWRLWVDSSGTLATESMDPGFKD